MHGRGRERGLDPVERILSGLRDEREEGMLAGCILRAGLGEIRLVLMCLLPTISRLSRCAGGKSLLQ